MGDKGLIPGLGIFHLWSNEAQKPQLPKLERPRVHALKQEKPPQWEAQAPQLEKAHMYSNEDSAQTKINKYIIKKKF